MGGDPPRATACIQDDLISSELQALEHRSAPGRVRLRHAVVATGVPVSVPGRHGSSMLIRLCVTRLARDGQRFTENSDSRVTKPARRPVDPGSEPVTYT